MAIKKCIKCKEEIQDDAKKCKHCGSNLRNWFIRHKILTAILLLLAISLITSVTSDEKNTNQNPSTSNTSSDETVADDLVTKVTKENCDSVKIGMTKEQVINLLGEPGTTSESEMAGLGKTEYLHFQEGFSLKSCSVTLNNGKVFSKTWTDL